jgi:FlaA1/EpsC-like NDP-sugar epimerase
MRHPRRRRQRRVSPSSSTSYKRRVAEVLLDTCLVSVSTTRPTACVGGGEQFAIFFPASSTRCHSRRRADGVAYAAGAYRGIWQYFGLMDGVTFAKGVAYGTLSSVVIVVYLFRFERWPRGVFIIDGAILLVLLCASRASFRLLSEMAHRRRREGQRLVIYGAGDVGASAVRDILSRSTGG